MPNDDATSDGPVAGAGVLFHRRRERRTAEPTPWVPEKTVPTHPVVSDDSVTPVPGASSQRVTMTAWAAAARAGREHRHRAAPSADNPTLIEASARTRGFDSLLSVSALPREAFESGFDDAVEEALRQDFDLQSMLDESRDPGDDVTPPVDGEVRIPGLHELSDLGGSS